MGIRRYAPEFVFGGGGSQAFTREIDLTFSKVSFQRCQVVIFWLQRYIVYVYCIANVSRDPCRVKLSQFQKLKRLR